jgi:hypothetical protein
MSKKMLSTARSCARRTARLATRCAAAASLTVTTVVLVAVPAFADPVSATPSGAAIGAAAGKIQAIINLTSQGALWASLISVLVGAGVWGLSKHFGNYGGAHKGQILVLGGAAGALLASMAPAIVNGLFGV